jgi:hypothetical protein
MCAQTVYAVRNKELKARYTNNANLKVKPQDFNTQFNAVFLLLGTKRLSRHNTILCGKWIDEMADKWTSIDQLVMIDQLRERQTKSWKKWEKRIAEKQDAAAGATKGRGRKKEDQEPTTPAPSPDVWSL